MAGGPYFWMVDFDPGRLLPDFQKSHFPLGLQTGQRLAGIRAVSSTTLDLAILLLLMCPELSSDRSCNQAGHP